MANFVCELEGVRGRNLKLYDTKLVINTKKTVGSFITGNFTDGEKTIYLCDVVGVQWKKSGLLIGYLQFETPSMQMDHQKDNMFSENTFTYEAGKNGITNALIDAVYHYVTDRIEELKYNVKIIDETPDFEAMKDYSQNSAQGAESETYTGPLDDDFSGMQPADKWKKAWAYQGNVIGQCDLCGKKKQQVVFAEFKDFFGTAEKNMCFECFSNCDCNPKSKAK